MTEEREGGGPVPVRDLMKAPGRAPEDQGPAKWEGDEREFEHRGETWSARPAGSGAYGTGNDGTARILAVHFYRDGDPEPRREALIPRAAFEALRDEELRELLDRATPIEREDD